MSVEAWEIDGLAGEAAGLAHKLLCDLLMARGAGNADAATRAMHRARAAGLWPALSGAMGRLAEAAPLSAADGQEDAETLLNVVEAVQRRAGFRATQPEDVMGDAATFASGVLASLRQAERAGERGVKRAFAEWPSLGRRMARLVQAEAQAADEAANAVRETAA